MTVNLEPSVHCMYISSNEVIFDVHVHVLMNMWFAFPTKYGIGIYIM